MDALLPQDWSQVLLLDVPVIELFARVTLIYLGLYVLLRFILKREVGGLGLTDLLVIVLLADAVQNGMAGQYNSVGSALILGGTLIFWAFAISWLSYHSKFLQKVLNPSPVLLIKDGKLIQRNMRRELVTRQELLGELRMRGIERIEDVWEARMEEDGNISVIQKHSPEHPEGLLPKPKRKAMR